MDKKHSKEVVMAWLVSVGALAVIASTIIASREEECDRYEYFTEMDCNADWGPSCIYYQGVFYSPCTDGVHANVRANTPSGRPDPATSKTTGIRRGGFGHTGGFGGRGG